MNSKKYLLSFSTFNKIAIEFSTGWKSLLSNPIGKTVVPDDVIFKGKLSGLEK
jgi:hypothetical protein